MKETVLVPKLCLFLLALLFHPSSGFTVTLKGMLTGEPCSGEESEDIKECVMAGVEEADPSLADVLTDHLDGGFFINGVGKRQLQANSCGGCPNDGSYPRGSFCATFCNNGNEGYARRLVEDGASTGDDESKEIADGIMACLGDNHGCLGSTGDWSLTVTL